MSRCTMISLAAWGLLCAPHALCAGVQARSEGRPAFKAPAARLGGVALPYAGQGAVEYDAELQQWTFLFPAPEGWSCTHVGWEFDGPPADAITLDPNEDRWIAAGYLDIDVADGILFVRIFTAEDAYELTFLYDSRLADPDLELVPAGPGPLLDDNSCPGGSCSCGNNQRCGGCTACCSSGFHPRCVDCGQNDCRCECIRNRAGQLQPVRRVPAPRVG